MFYKVELRDHIRVPPKLFHLDAKEAVIQRVKKKFDGFISKEIGIVIDVADIKDIGEGKVISGDGASYYDCSFELFVFRPEVQEVVPVVVRDIADFGAFMNMGPMDGMIHVSQTMDDFVSFSKEKVLTGKDSGRTLKIGDLCTARVVAVSYKDITNPKIGLTMRQKFLGKPEWATEELKKTATKSS